jgi:pimeloyl-ACP methyl ester carboxylesterase
MMPLYFGTAQRRLFGIYSPPLGAAAAGRAAVLCYPWGQEYLRIHRSLRQLAGMLCTGGYHVLRFDYFGTGDSSGDMLETDLKGWEQDIETAMEELKDTSGVRRLTLVGVRLGATLAARVAARHVGEVEALVLWDPVVRGAEYLDELLGAHSGPSEPPPEELIAGEPHEIHGFPLTNSVQAEIREIDLTTLVPALPARTRVMVSAPLPSHGALQEQLRRRGGEAAMEQVDDGLAVWLEQDVGAGAVPARVLEAIAGWLC